MSINQPFTDPIITMKRGKDQPYLTILEEIFVDDQGKAILTEIPYRYDRVQILEQTGGDVNTGAGSISTPNNQSWISTDNQDIFTITNGTVSNVKSLFVFVGGIIQPNITLLTNTSFQLPEQLSANIDVFAVWFASSSVIENSTILGSETVIFPSMYEISQGSPNNNQYIVDYTQGVLTFNTSQVGAKFYVKYTGTGFHYFPSSRVSYQQNLDGSITTIKQVLDSSVTTINNIQNATDNANTAANNATNATANFQSLLDQQKLIYKQSVANYAAIATTYPTPELGWRVVAKDTGIAYRYDGTTWLEVDMSTTSEGFNVTISDAAPANVNVLWLNIPNVNRTSRVVKSTTAPADTSVIWWQP